YSASASRVLFTRSTVIFSRCPSRVDSDQADTTAMEAISASIRPKPANMRLPTVKRCRKLFMTHLGGGCALHEGAPGRPWTREGGGGGPGAAGRATRAELRVRQSGYRPGRRLNEDPAIRVAYRID